MPWRSSKPAATDAGHDRRKQVCLPQPGPAGAWVGKPSAWICKGTITKLQLRPLLQTAQHLAATGLQAQERTLARWRGCLIALAVAA